MLGFTLRETGTAWVHGIFSLGMERPYGTSKNMTTGSGISLKGAAGIMGSGKTFGSE